MIYTEQEVLMHGWSFGVCFELFLALALLKLLGVVSWSWWWVTASLWGWFILALVVFVLTTGLVYLSAEVRSLRTRVQRFFGGGGR